MGGVALGLAYLAVITAALVFSWVAWRIGLVLWGALLLSFFTAAGRAASLADYAVEALVCAVLGLVVGGVTGALRSPAAQERLHTIAAVSLALLTLPWLLVPGGLLRGVVALIVRPTCYAGCVWCAGRAVEALRTRIRARRDP